MAEKPTDLFVVDGCICQEVDSCSCPRTVIMSRPAYILDLTLTRDEFARSKFRQQFAIPLAEKARIPAEGHVVHWCGYKLTGPCKVKGGNFQLVQTWARIDFMTWFPYEEKARFTVVAREVGRGLVYWDADSPQMLHQRLNQLDLWERVCRGCVTHLLLVDRISKSMKTYTSKKRPLNWADLAAAW